jgi:predicted RNA-binding protein with PIN domain
MPFLVDGHNLIGSMPGLQLDDPDDEAKLVALLRSFSAREGVKLTVFFDRGQPGAPIASASGVTARFARLPDTADDALKRRLVELGREARQWIVVSSDGDVVAAARRAGARSIPSRVFAARLRATPSSAAGPEKPDGVMTPEELESWEDLFRKDNSP